MGLVTWVREKLLGKPPATKPRPSGGRPLRAKYDAAQTTSENRNHWANADDLSANAANSPDVRRTLRRRARYERDNDPHLDGLAKQLAHDLIGTGPRLQLTLGVEHQPAAALVMASWKTWARAVDLGEKLRLLHEPRAIDGEAFALLVTNPVLAHPVKLDVRPLEQEQVATPGFSSLSPTEVDGIEFDAYGNPSAYHVLRQHPGDSWTWGFEADRVPARYVVHWYRPKRPSQARGASELAASLPIGAQTRRYAAAVLTKAEFAAMLAGVMETELPPPEGDEDAPDITLMDEVPMARGGLLTVPHGWKAKQFEANDSTDTYEQFVTSKRAEMGRPVLAPRNRITGDSSQFNFASGRLDSLPYQDLIWIERDRFRNRVLDRLFLVWYAEMRLLGLIPDTLPAVNEWVWDWHWDGFSPLSPIDEATAIEMRLALHLTTLSEECAAEGKDWREVIDQRAVEHEYIRSKGLLPDPAPDAVTRDATP